MPSPVAKTVPGRVRATYLGLHSSLQPHHLVASFFTSLFGTMPHLSPSSLPLEGTDIIPTETDRAPQGQVSDGCLAWRRHLGDVNQMDKLRAERTACEMLRAQGVCVAQGPGWGGDRSGRRRGWRGHLGQTERALNVVLRPDNGEVTAQNTFAPRRGSVSTAWRAQHRAKKAETRGSGLTQRV